MKLHWNRKLWALATAAVLLCGLAACATNANGVSSAPASSVAAENTEYSAENTDAAWSETDARACITLKGTAIAVDGEGATAEGTLLTITEGGLYILDGSLDDGQILVDAPSTDTVRIVLNGASITSETSAGIYAAGADKLILTLADGTQNSVQDAGEYSYADAAAQEPDAAIFSKCDLTINGTGSLAVAGNFNNGIGTKDDLVVASGTLNVTAANHGLRGRDSVAVLDGDLTIVAGSDGIQSNNDEDSSKGWINLSGGTFQITSASDGIQAETSLTISGGEYSITAGGGNAAVGVQTANGSDSYKGIKAESSVQISGGET